MVNAAQPTATLILAFLVAFFKAHNERVVLAKNGVMFKLRHEFTVKGEGSVLRTRIDCVIEAYVYRDTRWAVNSFLIVPLEIDEEAHKILEDVWKTLSSLLYFILWRPATPVLFIRAHVKTWGGSRE